MSSTCGFYFMPLLGDDHTIVPCVNLNDYTGLGKLQLLVDSTNMIDERRIEMPIKFDTLSNFVRCAALNKLYCPYSSVFVSWHAKLRGFALRQTNVKSLNFN